MQGNKSNDWQAAVANGKIESPSFYFAAESEDFCFVPSNNENIFISAGMAVPAAAA